MMKDYICISYSGTMELGHVENTEEDDGCLLCCLELYYTECEKKYTLFFRPSHFLEE